MQTRGQKASLQQDAKQSQKIQEKDVPKNAKNKKTQNKIPEDEEVEKQSSSSNYGYTKGKGLDAVNFENSNLSLAKKSQQIKGNKTLQVQSSQSFGSEDDHNQQNSDQKKNFYSQHNNSKRKPNLDYEESFDDSYEAQNEIISEKTQNHKQPETCKKLVKNKISQALEENDSCPEQNMSYENQQSDASNFVENEKNVSVDEQEDKELAIKSFLLEKRQLEKNQKQVKFLKCCYCPKEYSQSKNLWEHKTTKHPFKLLEYYKRGYLCQYCYKFYLTIEGRDNHEEYRCLRKPQEKKSNMKTPYQKHLDDLFDQVQSLKANSNKHQKKQNAEKLKKTISKH